MKRDGFLNMIDLLYNFLNQFAPISESEKAQLERFLYVKNLKSGEILFQEGKPSDVVAFVLRGFMFSYYTTANQEYKVKKFAWEGRITSPYSTLIMGKSICYFSAVALEDSALVCINYKDLSRLCDTHACWQKIGRRIAELSLVERENREYEALCLPLSERYEIFLERHHDILHRIPQYLIASYLGVSPVSLSRIRAQRLSAVKK